MYPNHTLWLEKISSAETSSKLGNLWISSGDHPQDESTAVLKDLEKLGYDTIEWHSGANSCDACKAHNLHTWSISDFVANLVHDAPVFERSHVGCRSCHLIVNGPNLEPVQVGPWPFT